MTFHRDRELHEHLNTRPCAFCQRSDPNFSGRKVEDKLIRSNGSDAAPSHVTEDGHVLHRMAELEIRRSFRSPGTSRVDKGEHARFVA